MKLVNKFNRNIRVLPLTPYSQYSPNKTKTRMCPENTDCPLALTFSMLRDRAI